LPRSSSTGQKKPRGDLFEIVHGDDPAEVTG
jgi:hypothetical protein